MGKTFKVGLVQTCAGADMTETLDRAEALSRKAAADGAEMIVLAEYFSCYHVDETGIHTGPVAENEHPALRRFSALSRELGIWSVLGSVAVPSPDGRSYNRQYVFDDTGAVRATYEKIHLFDVNLSAGEQYKESATLSPGARAVTTDTPWG